MTKHITTKSILIPDKVIFNSDRGQVTALYSKNNDGKPPYLSYTSRASKDDVYDKEFGLYLCIYKSTFSAEGAAYHLKNNIENIFNRYESIDLRQAFIEGSLDPVRLEDEVLNGYSLDINFDDDVISNILSYNDTWTFEKYVRNLEKYKARQAKLEELNKIKNVAGALNEYADKELRKLEPKKTKGELI